jgi:two-component system cell cycle response regulator
VLSKLLKRGPLSNRSEPREPVHLRAQIIFDAGTIDCLIKDVSRRGARLKVDNVLAVPALFELSSSGGQRRPVKVRWRRKGEIGIAFVERRAFGRRGSC